MRDFKGFVFIFIHLALKWIYCYEYINTDSSPSFSYNENRLAFKNRLSLPHYLAHRLLQPDVIKCAPNCLLGVKYKHKVRRGNRIVEVIAKGELGRVVSVKNASIIPTLQWLDREDFFYTVIMLDPDSPKKKKPKYRHWLHWLVVNLPGWDIGPGETLAEYVGPWPEKGTGRHRYAVLVYEFNHTIDYSDFEVLDKENFVGRRNFNLKKFVKKYNHTNIVASNVFRSKYDKYVKKLYGKYI